MAKNKIIMLLFAVLMVMACNEKQRRKEKVIYEKYSQIQKIPQRYLEILNSIKRKENYARVDTTFIEGDSLVRIYFYREKDNYHLCIKKADESIEKIKSYDFKTKSLECEITKLGGVALNDKRYNPDGIVEIRDHRMEVKFSIYQLYELIKNKYNPLCIIKKVAQFIKND